MVVAEIWRFPVKSLRGESLTSVEVGPAGIAYDRAWSILNAETQMNLTARRSPDLLLASAAMHGDQVVVTLPDGSEAADDDSLSAWLGLDVALTRASADTGGKFENPMDFENDADWVSWDGPKGAFHDSGRTRVSLVSQASFGQWEPARFRTNLILSGLDSRAEEAWVGQSVTIGKVRLDVAKLIDRCVMVTRAQPGIDRDLNVLRTINAEHHGCLGVGATVAEGGVIEVGSSIEP